MAKKEISIEDEITYEEAKGELQSILHKLEEGQASIEELETLVARSKWLVQYCQKRLMGVKSKLESMEDE